MQSSTGLEVAVSGENIEVRYSLGWLFDVMRLSCTSMVPFFSVAVGSEIPTDRTYPRDASALTLLDGLELKGEQYGSRRRGAILNVIPLTQLLKGERPLPLSDISILCKRAVCEKLIQKTTKGAVGALKVSGGVPVSPPSWWPVFGYPMLCIVGTDKIKKKLGADGKKPAIWRVLQCVFGVALTQRLRASAIGLEVVSREGFGSLFPTLSDLGWGMRLDPGLLPVEEGAVAIKGALEVLAAFVEKAIIERGFIDKHLEPLVDLLSGDTSSSSLKLVDHLMAYLHSCCGEAPTQGQEFVIYLAKLNVDALAEPRLLTPTKKLAGAVRVQTKDSTDDLRKKAKSHVGFGMGEKSGYGSDSEYEDEVESESGQKQIKFVMKKCSVASGMFATNLPLFYGKLYSKFLFLKGGLSGRDESVSRGTISHGGLYYQIPSTELLKVEESEAGVQVLVCDGAPNPFGLRKVEEIRKTGFAVIIVDGTNNTSKEKALYLDLFKSCLVQGDGHGGIIVLADSVSKHPTGGDLMHGVIRIVGTPSSVDYFFSTYLVQHLSVHEQKEQTILNEEENLARKQMKEARLVTRNRDLVLWEF